MATVTPATQIVKPDWTCFTLTKTPATDTEGALINAIAGNVSFASHEFLGNPEGVPQRIIRLSLNPSARYVEPSQIMDEEFLGEVVTLADGTSITLYELLDRKLTAAINATTNPAV